MQESLVATKISIRIKHTQRGIIHEFCCFLKRLLPTRFPSMYRRMLLQGLSRVHGNMFVPLHKVGLASHICHENFDAVCPARRDWDRSQSVPERPAPGGVGRHVSGHHESAGKRQSGKTRKGSRWLRQVLIEAANSLVRSTKSYLAVQYRRLAARRGKKKAIVAVGHSILVIAYDVLTRQEPYRDLGPNSFDERDRQRVERHLGQRLERLGYAVELKPRCAGASTPECRQPQHFQRSIKSGQEPFLDGRRGQKRDAVAGGSVVQWDRRRKGNVVPAQVT